MQHPIALTDDQMSHILAMAQPLTPADRDSYLKLLAELLSAEPEVGDGAVGRAAREAQRQFLKPPTLEDLRSVPSNRRRRQA